MDKRSLNALEYNKITQLLEELTINEEAKDLALNLEPKNNLHEINTLLSELDSMVSMVLRNGNLPIVKIKNIKPLIERSRISSVLSMGELLDINEVLSLTENLISYYKSDSVEEDIILSDYFKTLNSCLDLKRNISKKIISPTEMDDNASPNLKKIRKEIDQKNRSISKKLDSIIGSAQNEKYLQEKLVSIRNGRYVIPVLAKYRDKFPGAVLDRSSSGQTLFIEPISVLNLNNEIKELEILEKKEIEKILRILTEEVKSYYYELKNNYEMIIALDFLFAKALMALNTNSNRVTFSEDEIFLKQARHPLINQDKVVSSTIKINQDNKILVITGPNTGGKTVTLKTLGLLSAMAQSGLFIPVNSNSTIKFFNNIFADIGDEQSIEQNLSTFSAHLTNIVHILNDSDKESLVLLDELGAGTDPTEGAALAISILDYLKNRVGLTAATTHYPEIKEYALLEDDVLNASVEFDLKTLKPTYRLQIGLPGKSNAFEIANSLGLYEEIINSSQNRLNNKHKDFDKTLGAAQEELSLARKRGQKAKEMYDRAKTILEEAKLKRDKVNEQAEKVLLKANSKAKKIVESTKNETDIIYREIQKIQRDSNIGIDNKKLERLRNNIRDIEKKTNRNVQRNTNKNAQATYTIEDFKKGDRVYIKSLDREADILEVNKKDKKVEILSGSIRMKFKPNDLIKVEKKKQKNAINVSMSRPKVNTRLDLRGKTVDETYELIDNFVNDAVFLGVNKLEVIHGFGTGLVRKAVHDYLRKNSFVKSFRLGGPGEGGAGATIIEL